MADEQEHSSGPSVEDAAVDTGKSLVGAAVFLLLLPAVVIGFFYSLLYTRGRLRISMVALVVTAVDVICGLLWWLLDASRGLMALLKHLLKPGEYWQGALPALVLLFTVIGGFVGLALTAWQLRQYRETPHKREMKGNWMYHFQYRRTPWELMKRKRLIEALKAGSLEEPGRSPLGLDEMDEIEVGYQYSTEAARHTIITGTTGSGKTITLFSKIKTDIDMGKSIVVLDMKRSPEFAAKLATWAEANGSAFYHFQGGTASSYDIPCSPGPARYNPLASADVNAKVEMIMGMRAWDTASEVYATHMKDLLTMTFAMLEVADRSSVALQHDMYRQVIAFGGKNHLKKYPKGKEKVFAANSGVMKQFESAENAPGPVRTWLEDERYFNHKRNEQGVISLYRTKDGKVTDKFLTPFLVKLGVLQKYKGPIFDWSASDFQLLSVAFEGNNIEQLAKACFESRLERELYNFVDRLNAKNSPLMNAVQELRGYLRILIGSSYGEWLQTYDNTRNINLEEIVESDHQVILFSLNADSDAKFAKMMGSLIMANITNASSGRRNTSAENAVAVYIDEYQTLHPDAVSGLLEKSRASNIAVTLTQQSFEHVAKETGGGDTYVNALVETVGSFIIHSGSTLKTATFLSDLMGTEEYETYTVTKKHNGRSFAMNWGNKRDEVVGTKLMQRPRFAPNHFLSLSLPIEENGYKATAVYITKESGNPRFADVKGATARVLWMIPQEEVLKKYYHGRATEPGTEERKQEILEELRQPPEELQQVGGATEASVWRPSVASLEVDEEELDGGFVLEELADDELPEEESFVPALSENFVTATTPAPEVKPAPAQVRKAHRPKTLESLQRQERPQEPVTELTAFEVALMKNQGESGATAVQPPQEEEALPDFF